MRRTAAVLMLSSLWWSSTARADEAPDAPTLLRDPAALVHWLSTHDPEVAAASAHVDQSAADVGTAGLVPNPQFSIALEGLPIGTTNPPGLGAHDTTNTTYALGETIELGKRGPRKESARLMHESVRETRLDTLAQRAADARLALGQVVRLKARQALLEETLASARSVLQLETAREKAGDLSGNDLDRLELDNLALEQDIARARAEVLAAESDCRARLALTCDPGPLTPADIEALPEVPPGTPDELKPSLAERPDARALDRERESAQSDVTLANRRKIPDPTLGVSYVHDNLLIAGNQPKTWGVSLGLGIPLFDRGQHDAARASAHARAAETERDALLRRTTADLESLLARRTMVESTLAQLVASGIPRGASILATTQKALDQGESSMTDLLLARRAQATLLLSEIDLRFELFSVRNELRRTLGLDAAAARASTSGNSKGDAP